MDRAQMIEELRRRYLAQQGIVDAPPPVMDASAFQGLLARGLLTAPMLSVLEGMKGPGGMLPRRPPIIRPPVILPLEDVPPPPGEEPPPPPPDETPVSS